MNFQFNTVEEFDLLWQSVHDSIIYWKKVRQMCQGKINLNVDGSETHYDEKYCIDQMVSFAQLLKTIEDTPHPEWNGSSYSMSSPTINSHIVTKTLKLASGVDNDNEE